MCFKQTNSLILAWLKVELRASFFLLVCFDSFLLASLISYENSFFLELAFVSYLDFFVGFFLFLCFFFKLKKFINLQSMYK